MARIEGVSSREAGWFAKAVFWYSKRKFGRVMEVLRITAHSPKVLHGTVDMEKAQGALESVDKALTALAEIKVATMVGCPF